MTGDKEEGSKHSSWAPQWLTLNNLLRYDHTFPGLEATQTASCFKNCEKSFVKTFK